MRLIDLQSGQPINIGDKVVTFDGMVAILNAVQPPHKPGSTGRVTITVQGSSFTRDYYPTVINAKFCDGEDVA